MTLAEYVKKRNGVPIGDSGSLKYNLYKSLGAKNFSTFWMYWNPIFGYYLGTKIFKPLKKVFSPAISLVLTFVFCGLIHDVVSTVVGRRISWFFTIWFLLMGVSVLLLRYFRYDFSKKDWVIRAITNLSIISICLLLTIYINSFIKTL